MDKNMNFIESGIKNCKSDEQIINSLKEVIESAFGELKTLNSQNAMLKSQLEMNSAQIEAFTSDYQQIKEQHSQMETQIKELRKEIEHLNVALVAKESEYNSKYAELKQREIQTFETELKKKKKKLDLLGVEHDSKIYEIQNELRSIRYESITKMNKVDFEMSDEIDNYKKKHIENNKTIYALRDELLRAKQRLLNYKLQSNQEICALESKICLKEKQEIVESEAVINNEEQTNLERENKQEKACKYPALNVEFKNATGTLPPLVPLAENKAKEVVLIDFDYEMNEFDEFEQ